MAEMDQAGYTIRLHYDDGMSAENSYKWTRNGYEMVRMAFNLDELGEVDASSIRAFADSCENLHSEVL